MFDDLPLILAQGGEAAPSGDTGQAPASNGQATEGQPASPQQGPAGTQPGGNGPGGGLFSFPIILLLILGVMLIFMMSSQRKEKKRKQEMQASLKKGAKVTTVGGIIGTVVEVRDDEVVVKVDENANTRLRFSRNAIASAQSPEQQQEPAS